MAASKRCIICLNYLKSKKKLIPRHSLEEQTVIMYFLRKLAWSPVSEEELEKFLKHGNPSEWASFCYICEEQVKKCLDMHMKVQGMIGEITSIRKMLYKENFYESEGEDEGESSVGNSGGPKGVFNLLREQLFSDFMEGGEETGRFEESIEITYKTADDVEGSRGSTPTGFLTVKEEKMDEEEEEMEDESQDYSGTFSNESNDLEEDSNQTATNESQGILVGAATATRNDEGAPSSTQIDEELDELLPDKTARECPRCGKVFSSFHVLKRHFRESHLKVKNLQCSICSKSFSRKEYLVAHIDLKHPENMEEFGNIGFRPSKEYPCPHCPVKFSVGRALKMHMIVKHGKIKRSVKLLKRNKNLASHKNTALKNEKRASTQNDKERTWPCPQCSRLFIKKLTMERHVRETHDKIRDFVCPHCGKTSSRKRDLERHVYTIHGAGKCESQVKEDLKCSICRRYCGNRRTFDNHMRRVHNVKEGVQCDVCGRSYSNAESLAIHKATIHPEESESNDQEGGTESRLPSQEEIPVVLAHVDSNAQEEVESELSAQDEIPRLVLAHVEEVAQSVEGELILADLQ